MKTVIIDNYDSFTYNLFHYVEMITDNVQVFRNDAISLNDMEQFDRIILSPGPGLPAEAGITMKTIAHFSGRKPILGICLGHQAIVEAFGGQLINLDKVLHGVSVEVEINNSDTIFKGLPPKIQTGRYHSFVADSSCLPVDLKVIASDANGTIQGVRHQQFDIVGLQFHPESILTDFGFSIIKNWFLISH
ncbi:MAG: aminodeoxychorismate/anthranilate synthase component II [Bacteroidales bacterium]|nr:aminodeoxychorismate/anthranilate synthase component II [Bacteroidales bacterium]